MNPRDTRTPTPFKGGSMSVIESIRMAAALGFSSWRKSVIDLAEETTMLCAICSDPHWSNITRCRLVLRPELMARSLV